MQFKDKCLDLSSPRVMGILNVTPDSFSDGGTFNMLENGLAQTGLMLSEGADIIDIGGESTRPGAQDVSIQQELDRVIPVIESICQRFDTIISIDTSKAQVMTEAINAGASLINDVRALQENGALEAAVAAKVPVCLMHMQGQPRVMQQNPHYEDVVKDVMAFLQQRIAICRKAGIAGEQIIVDPGFGFGKSLEHNYQMLANFEKFHRLNVPVLAGMSRKSMLGHLLQREIGQRLAGNVAVATVAAQKGAQIIRVHDVKETVDAVKIINMINACRNNNER
ncbi:dihydropteroate synthase [Paraglaciecola sp. MB-3u-78]|jgi:dihydropteroate synthase|uniref:dihydropteroate synthase n=1 Tax=Paraglaciecola sp. MB-3u-78 TaxID=2058332 RepID=UPI000C3267B7|nr:dihydropteroate synthase [Paraglaciecola sp. MB-3u-78]PKG99072.1 dihydropteroate synthase [Paraglaciecola sp. MB-3u-78]